MTGQGSVTVFLGPPGIGKGTQAKILVEKLGVVHLSTGDVIRAEKSSGSSIGKMMTEIGWSNPDLLDKLVLEPLHQRLMGAKEKSIILDGFPRSRMQAEWLDDMLARDNRTLTQVIEFCGDRENVASRMQGRFSCADKSCQAIYHDTNKPTRIPGQCDLCGSQEFFRRPEDTAEIIKDRFESFQRMSLPMIEYYKSLSLVRSVNGLALMDEVTAELLKLF